MRTYGLSSIGNFFLRRARLGSGPQHFPASLQNFLSVRGSEHNGFHMFAKVWFTTGRPQFSEVWVNFAERCKGFVVRGTEGISRRATRPRLFGQVTRKRVFRELGINAEQPPVR
jgi:hypothetical protein